MKNYFFDYFCKLGWVSVLSFPTKNRFSKIARASREESCKNSFLIHDAKKIGGPSLLNELQK
jgi:hypothetical protein